MNKNITKTKNNNADKATKVENAGDAEAKKAVEALNPVERKNLEAYEKTIVTHNLSPLGAGLALGKILAQKLYRETFDTFEEYCAKTWSWSRQHAYRLIKSATTWQHLIDTLSPIGDIQLPKNESQVRELAPLGEDKDKWERAWKKAVKLAKGQTVTAALVTRAVDLILGNNGDATTKDGETDNETEDLGPAPQLKKALTFIEAMRKDVKTLSHEDFEEALGDLHVLIEEYLKTLAE
jgi:hypothetical protein